MGRDAAGGLSWATGLCLCCWVGRGRRGAIRVAERRAKGAMVELEIGRGAEGKRESELRDGASGELGAKSVRDPKVAGELGARKSRGREGVRESRGSRLS
ncbi:hypothetical protein CRG98_029798 [Punica granatum]|uniref:Uncharacterized protein n=1 Tax=Punica granatum TaxID=22663 RepID=A0A2I0J0P4_PUNGR|nr:hypothetical protein CRG98_029798 [Punica granatum]